MPEYIIQNLFFSPLSLSLCNIYFLLLYKNAGIIKDSERFLKRKIRSSKRTVVETDDIYSRRSRRLRGRRDVTAIDSTSPRGGAIWRCRHIISRAVRGVVSQRGCFSNDGDKRVRAEPPRVGSVILIVNVEDTKSLFCIGDNFHFVCDKTSLGVVSFGFLGVTVFWVARVEDPEEYPEFARRNAATQAER